MSRKPSNPPSSPKVKRGPAPEPAAADRLDAAVYQILQKLKAGTAVRLPGLGILRPGPRKSVLFDVLQSGESKEGTDAGKQRRRR
jgi:nucleoid DNA-binding protein